LLLAEIRPPQNKVDRHHCRRHDLNRDVRQAVAAMARQLLFWSVRARTTIKICQDGRTVDHSKRKPTAGTVQERNKQAEREQQYQRQPVDPTSD